MQHAYARLDGDKLTIGNDLIERSWQIRGQRLLSATLLDKTTGQQWCREIAPAGPGSPESPSANTATTESSASSAATAIAVAAPPIAATLTATRTKTAVSAEYLQVQIALGNTLFRFEIFDDLPAITQQIIAPPSARSADQREAISPTGIEVSPKAKTIDEGDLVDCLATQWLHCDFIAVEMLEQTDDRDNLVFEKRWMLQPAECDAKAAGNVFFLENRATRQGIAILKHAPAPHARPHKNGWDCAAVQGLLQIRGRGLDHAGGEGYRHTFLCYRNGKAGRTAALQAFQHHLRTYQPGRDGQFLSNTWGDRNRDAALSESFLLNEIDAGAKLGVDVMQIDDGWQRGRSANSAERGGVWNGFWASDPNFWSPDPKRLPNGFAPLLERLKRHNMRLGLWFAPDSSDNCANWQRDIQQVLQFHRDWNVHHVKIDAVKMHSKSAEGRVSGFYKQILDATAGAVCFDADVTAEIRPGFWAGMETGPIFVENRYTDWHRYWPHLTLRNLWLLAHYIPPVRLRMEFLNILRNQEKYGDDPLAPARYSPDTLFAMVMFASPLGWFEVSRLPESYVAKLPALVSLWKQHRAAIHSGITHPIGAEPDGFSWTGLRSSSGFAVVFNELSEERSFELPARSAELLHGDASVSVSGATARITINRPLGHAFVRLT